MSTRLTAAVTPTRQCCADHYTKVRKDTEAFCARLLPEDHEPQPIEDVSPPKWHLGHATWFYEQMLLQRFLGDYTPYDSSFSWFFNSYYESFGPRVDRLRRGALSRPTLEQVRAYRAYLDHRILELIEGIDDTLWSEFSSLLTLALHHEQQHLELLLTDAKYILACNPTHPAYAKRHRPPPPPRNDAPCFLKVSGGVREIGHDGHGFSYDNERPRHKTYMEPFRVRDRLVTNAEYREFIEDEGYRNFDLWLSDGWTEVTRESWQAPLYWQQHDGEWFEFTLYGLEPLDPAAPVCHVSYYEAEAFARWSGKRLLREDEWEVAVNHLGTSHEAPQLYGGGLFHPSGTSVAASSRELKQAIGTCWEWTASAYLPYPGYRRVAGALGEYNGKFMVNQMVLRGGSIATATDHVRSTYRNFFQPQKRWQFQGIRLAEDD